MLSRWGYSNQFLGWTCACGKDLRGSLPKKKLLPYIFIINTTIHPKNEITVRMRKLFILLPFPAFHCWTTVSG